MTLDRITDSGGTPSMASSMNPPRVPLSPLAQLLVRLLALRQEATAAELFSLSLTIRDTLPDDVLSTLEVLIDRGKVRKVENKFLEGVASYELTDVGRDLAKRLADRPQNLFHTIDSA